MHLKLIVLLTLISVVRNHDVSIGSDGGRKIFEDTRFASPAIWRQVENVTVIAPNNEVISKVNITDMRADKDGDVDIVNGGEGEKSVTIEIKSPTVLRGYEFHIEVFSVPESNLKISNNSDKTGDMPEMILNNEYTTTVIPQKSGSESSETNKDIPTSMAKDSDVFRPARETNDENGIEQLPEASETKTMSTETAGTEESTTTENYSTTIETEENQDGTTESVEGSGSDEIPAPVLPSDWLRPAREANSGNELPEMPVENEVAITTTETSNEDTTTIGDILTPSENVGHQESTSEVPEFVTTVDDVTKPAGETSSENELTVTTTETLNKDTTEDISKANGEDTLSTPNTYINSKDIPIYSSLSILDYIKKKEQGNRQIRRTEDKIDTSDTQSSSEEQTDENENSLSTTESTNPTNESDDTVDLVPPEVDAAYSTDFSPDLERGTEDPNESSSSYTNSRTARRIELVYDDEGNATPETSTLLDVTTEDSTPINEDATTESSLEEKSRNSRNTEDNLENADNIDLTSESGTAEPNSVATDDNIASGIVIIKGDRVIVTADGRKVQFTLPIVLVIGNENNFPIFKLVEDSSDIENVDESASSLIGGPDTTMDYEERDAAENANDFVKTDEYSY